MALPGNAGSVGISQESATRHATVTMRREAEDFARLIMLNDFKKVLVKTASPPPPPPSR